MLWGEWLDWDQYADAYKEGADRLVASLEGLPYEDSLLCPIIFMYRHYVELRPKQLVYALDQLGGTQMPDKLFIKHDLLSFWSCIESHLDCIKEGLGSSRLDPLRSLIEQLARLDRDSMHFRYSLDKTFNKMPVPYCLDIRHFKNMMGIVSNGLGYIQLCIDWEKECRFVEAEYYADMY